MALSLPTTSNTTGEFSNSVLAANMTSTAFTRDSKFHYANAQNERTGVSVSISANGDYAVIGNRARNAQDNQRGFPFILSRSGNTWSTMTSLVVQTSANTTTSSYAYSGWNDVPQNRNVSIDNAGETVVIGASGTNVAGRIEIWERSGSTWSFGAGFDGTENNQYLGFNGCVLSGDGTSIIVGGGAYIAGGISNKDVIRRYIKSGGSWSLDFSANATYGIGSPIDYSKDGTKYVYLNNNEHGNTYDHTNANVIIQTSYYDGSSWNNVTTSVDQTGYGRSRADAVRMSGDGNYLGVSFIHGTSTDYEGRLHIFVWDSSSNNWNSQTVLLGKSGTPGFAEMISMNSDGTKLVTGGNAQSNNPWIAFKRSGSTWSQEKQTTWPQGNMTGNGITEMSNDGYHLLLAAPQTYWEGSNYGYGSHERGMVEYWVPTGVGVSSVSNGQIATHQGRRFRYNSAKQRWTPANKVNLTGVATTRTRSAGVASSSLSGETLSINGLTVDVGEFAGKTTTYANASIFPFSSLQAGDQAIALDTGYLYVTDGSGWFRVANSAIVT